MNFNELMQKMRELDQPVVQAEACGDPMPPMSPMSSPMSAKPDTPPPSLSINLNAQGMDNIESIMKLMTKVNPDMINQPPSMPMSLPISISKPSSMSMGPLGNLDSGPLKMLPDLDADNDDMPGGEMDSDYNDSGDLDAHEKDHADEKPLIKTLDRDDDGDHDMDDHDAEKKEKDEAFGNSLNGSEPEYGGIDAAIPDGNDMHKPKQSFSGKAYRGDNPMAAGAYESKEQLRASIREELLQRLSEAKGAK
jgi:hypothetical protein